MNRSSRIAVRCAVLLALLWGTGCGSQAETTARDGVQSRPLAFAAPQGIAAHARWILVANSAFHYSGADKRWGPGFVTVIDRATRQVASRVFTTQLNPRDIAIEGDTAYVVNTGTFELDADGLATCSSKGGIDIIDLSGEAAPTEVSTNLPLALQDDDPRIGAFGSIASSPDQRWAYVGSGTRGDVFKVDLRGATVTRGPDDPIVVFPTPAGENGMTVVRRLGDALGVIDFNSDQLCVSDDWNDDLAGRRCHGVGVNAELLEGPIDAALAPDGSALVLMSITNSVYRVDIAKEGFAVDHAYASTGLANNRVLVHGDHAYVINSTSNNLQRIAIESGEWDLPFAAFTQHANPYDMVITDESEGAVAWVTLFGTNRVALVALQSGEVLHTLDTEMPEPRDTHSASSKTTDMRVDCTDTVNGTHAADRWVGIAHVVHTDFGAGAGLGQDSLPAVVQGGPTGSGERGGATAGVLSLGGGGEIVVDFGEHEIVDGPGPDLIVFENAFVTAPYTPFAEPAVVGVSDGGTAAADFVDFPCDTTATHGDPEAGRWPFVGCAGVRPVYANVQRNCIWPADPQAAGGDAFDLATVGLSRARYLRIRDLGRSEGAPGVRGFDLDAVVLIHHHRRH